jgi:predicted DNA-binding transcriptional regulator YafY
MRADRLLSLLMLLQTRGRLTARRLAAELEVSERTIYRDITALSTAGVPVYSETGCTGGFSLVDSYRTQLTGLTEGEARALFMLNIPAPLTELGIGQELKTALLKLSASLPDARRSDQERVHQRFHLDSTGWRQGGEPVPHLPAVQHAVWRDCKLLLFYYLPFFSRIERVVEPYGLVAKAGAWYLVYNFSGRMRVIRLSELLDAQVLPEAFQRRLDFILVDFWEDWCKQVEAQEVGFKANVRIAPGLVGELTRYFGAEIREQIARAAPGDEQGRIVLELSFKSFEAARERLLGFGRAVEVLAPLPLRQSILDYAEQITDLYKG